MKILRRKLYRDLMRAKGMLSAVAAIIAVGIGSFTGMLATYNNLDHARAAYYSQCRMADAWIDLQKAPLADIKQLDGLPGITAYTARISKPVLVDLPDVEKPINGLALSMPATPQPVLNNIVLRRGGYFTPSRANEVIVSEKFAKARNLTPGMPLTLIINGRRRVLLIVGTAISAEHIYLAAPGSIVDNPLEYGVFYLKREFAEDAFGFHGAANNIAMKLASADPAQTAAVLKEAERRLAHCGVFAITPLPQQFSNLTLTSELGGVQTMATMLPMLFLSVAALVLNVLMTRLAEQQRVIIGTLKAMGCDNRAIFTHFIQYGLCVGIVGGLAGNLLGYWMAAGMTDMYRGFFEFPRLVNQFYPALFVTAMLIAMLFAVLGTLRGVKKVSRLNPAEAMRLAAPAGAGAIFLERWPALWRLLDFRWQIILRTLLRNKARTAIGAGAAAMGAALMVLAFGFVNSMNGMLQFQFSKVMLSDFNLVLKEDADADAARAAARQPGILLAEPVLETPGTFALRQRAKKAVITGLQAGAKLTVPCDAAGRPVRLPPAGLLMSERLAGHLGVRQGDTVAFTPVKGERRTYHLPVTRVITSMIGMNVYADAAWLNRLLGGAAKTSKIQLRATQTAAQRREFMRWLKTLGQLQAVEETATDRAIITRQFVGAMQGMAAVMIIFAGVIFFGSILNGSLIAITERQREIATFRVLGYFPSEIGTIFLRENLLVNLLGAAAGMPLGFWLLRIMIGQYSNDAYSMPAIIAPATWFWAMGLSLIFILTAHAVVQKNIRNLQWQEALSMKE